MDTLDKTMDALEVELKKVLKVHPFKRILDDILEIGIHDVPAVQIIPDNSLGDDTYVQANHRMWNLSYKIVVFDTIKAGNTHIKHTRKLVNKVANILEAENLNDRLNGEALNINVDKIDYGISENYDDLVLYGGIIEITITIIEQIE